MCETFYVCMLMYPFSRSVLMFSTCPGGETEVWSEHVVVGHPQPECSWCGCVCACVCVCAFVCMCVCVCVCVRGRQLSATF